MPKRPSRAEQPRGVYVDRGIGGAIEITVTASGGRDLMHVRVDPRFYDEALVQRLRRWLERADPRLRLMSE